MERQATKKSGLNVRHRMKISIKSISKTLVAERKHYDEAVQQQVNKTQTFSAFEINLMPEIRNLARNCKHSGVLKYLQYRLLNGVFIEVSDPTVKGRAGCFQSSPGQKSRFLIQDFCSLCAPPCAVLVEYVPTVSGENETCSPV